MNVLITLGKHPVVICDVCNDPLPECRHGSVASLQYDSTGRAFYGMRRKRTERGNPLMKRLMRVPAFAVLMVTLVASVVGAQVRVTAATPFNGTGTTWQTGVNLVGNLPTTTAWVINWYNATLTGTLTAVTASSTYRIAYHCGAK